MLYILPPAKARPHHGNVCHAERYRNIWLQPRIAVSQTVLADETIVHLTRATAGAVVLQKLGEVVGVGTRSIVHLYFTPLCKLKPYILRFTLSLILQVVTRTYGHCDYCSTA